jgi:hypothetical protein
MAEAGRIDMAWQKLFGERATTKIAAIFDTHSEACAVADRIRADANLNRTQVHIIGPDDGDFSKRLEPETAGVARTMIRTHLILGAVGFVFGLLIWAGLYAAEIQAVVSSPVLSAVAILFFSTSAGGLLAGLVTIRPDHHRIAERIQEAREAGKWAVVVHPRSPAQCDAVTHSLPPAAKVVRSV